MAGDDPGAEPGGHDLLFQDRARASSFGANAELYDRSRPRYQSNWTDAGKLFEQLYDSYPKLAPYHAYNAARCRLRRSDYTGAIEWAGKVAKGSVPEAEADLIRIDALRSLNRWDEALAALESHLGRFRGGLRHAEVLYKKAEATEKAHPGKDARLPGQQVQQEVINLYRRVWAEAPLEAWGERAGDRLEQIAAGLPAPEAAVVRGRSAAELVTRGMIYFDHNRNQESEAAFAAALGGARAERRLRVQGALLPRAVGLEGAAAPAGGAALRRGRRHLRQGRQPRSARQGALSGGAGLRLGREPRRGDGALHADRGRARRPQLRRRRADPDGGAGQRRR